MCCKQIWLVEYLHVDQRLFSSASDSLRSEGRAMLLAIAQDLAALKNLQPSVVLCSAAAEQVRLPRSVHVELLAGSGPQQITSRLDELIRRRGTADVSEHDTASLSAPATPQPASHKAPLRHDDRPTVVAIAPETDDLLALLTRQLRQAGHDVFGPSDRTISLCTDKWTTYSTLHNAGIPCVPTAIASQEPASDSSTYVIKPRCSTGCDGVRRLSRDKLQSWSRACHTTSDYLIQPYVDSVSWSFGMFASGNGDSLTVLPLTHQNIAWQNDRAVYLGGRIPADVPREAVAETQQLGHSIARAIGLTSGYVGVDLLQCPSTGRFLVTEVNPRFTTSYVGYRAACMGNPAEWWLGRKTHLQPQWKTTDVSFTAAGQISIRP